MLPGRVGIQGEGGRRARPTARRRGPTLGQTAFWAALLGALTGFGVLAPVMLIDILMVTAQCLFVLLGCWRILLAIVSIRPDPPMAASAELPPYTVLAALHHEAEVVDQLIRRLSMIDYPSDRLQILLLLEADDAETIARARMAARPNWIEVVVVPDGAPRTKPRALNYGLAMATGDLVTVYDAEDEPHPGQLSEAAARFGADTDARLGCLQAPLRIREDRAAGRRPTFLSKQFAIEYASLFEVSLPAMARLGLPFPLGGTSNHFRTDVLRDLGGWDAWNVTEDADLGFALWRAGFHLGVLRHPTWETAPTELYDWLPQRARWLKGYMQTWGVHTRDPAGLGVRGAMALALTTGGALVAAASHAPAMALLAAQIIGATAVGLPPITPVSALAVMIVGVSSAWLSSAVGARRARATYGVLDMISAPGAWALQTLAFGHAAWRLVASPFVWDKTAHTIDALDHFHVRLSAATNVELEPANAEPALSPSFVRRMGAAEAKR